MIKTDIKQNKKQIVCDVSREMMLISTHFALPMANERFDIMTSYEIADFFGFMNITKVCIVMERLKFKRVRIFVENGRKIIMAYAVINHISHEN